MKRILYPSILIVTILTGGVLAYSIWKASPVTSQQYFESGKKYYEQKKYSEATVQFLNAVQKDPKNRDARHLLALTYANQKNLNAAAQQLIALLEYFPDDTEFSLELGNIYLTGGRSTPDFFRQAAEIAQKVLAKDSQNVAALVLSGNASAGLQDYRSSVEQFEKAISLDPRNTPAFVSLGTAQMLQRNYPDAEQAYLKARQINPKDKDALMSLANYYRAVRDTAKAEALFQEALEAFPEEKDIYLQVVQFYYQEGRFAEVDRTLRVVQSRNAKDPGPLLLLADIYLNKNRTAEAQKLVMELKQKFPQNIDVAAKVAVSFMQDQPDRARAEIDAILKADPNNPVGPILLGELQFTTGQYAAAEATLATVPAINSSYPQPHYFLGNIAMRNGRIDEAQDHYQKSLALDSGSLSARVGLAQIFFNKGRLADAREEIRKVLNAEAEYFPARILKSALDTAEKNYPEAEKELMALVREQPDNALVHSQMGTYYEARGHRPDAEKSFVRAIELQPDSPEALQALTQFYIRGKQTDRAIQAIDAVPDAKRQAFHHELMGLVFSQAGRPQDAEKAYKKALEKDPDRATTQAYLTADYIQGGRLDEALKELDEMIQKSGSNASLHSTKGFVLEKQGKLEEAKQSYAHALKVDPNYETAANNLAYILADQGQDLQTALSWAQMARRKQPENPNNADTLGWVQYKLGNHVLASDQLKFAVSKEPDNPLFLYHLAMIYKETKQINEAQSALKKALASPRDFKEKQFAKAALREIGNSK